MRVQVASALATIWQAVSHYMDTFLSWMACAYVAQYNVTVPSALESLPAPVLSKLW